MLYIRKSNFINCCRFTRKVNKTSHQRPKAKLQNTCLHLNLFQDGTFFCLWLVDPLLLQKEIKLARLPQCGSMGSGSGLFLKAPLRQACLYIHKLVQECWVKTCQELNEDWVMRSNRGERGPLRVEEWGNSCPSLLHRWPPPLPASRIKNRGGGDFKFSGTWVGTSYSSGSPGDVSTCPKSET